MALNSSGFVGDIPAHYDRGLGPNIFEEYAARLAARCCEAKPERVVELAAGTGIVSRKLRDCLPPDVPLMVTDLNPPMLEVARGKFRNGENVDFKAANAMDLPFADNTFDLMLCQFGVMFFPDKPASFREAARVLKPGGHYIFNVWNDMSENPFSEVSLQAGERFFADDPPQFYKVPFHYSDSDLVYSDLAAAGWQDVHHEVIRIRRKIADPEAFAAALVHGNPLIDEIRERGGFDPEDVVAAILAGLRDAFGADDMTMPLSSTTFVCRAP